MSDEAVQLLIDRLNATRRSIETMLYEDRRESYFDALRRKAAGTATGNVTAQFFTAGA